MALTPVIAGATPSLMLVAIVKLLLKFRAGLKVTPASKALRSEERRVGKECRLRWSSEQETEHDVAGVRLAAATLGRGRVAVMLALSTSLATMSIRLSTVFFQAEDGIRDA